MLLGPHHFAFLRALVEGVNTDDAARLYLGMEHGHQLRKLHQQVVDALRAVARRNADSAWRLIGLRLHAGAGVDHAPALPDLATWSAAKGLQDWSHAEQLEMYNQALGLPEDGTLRRLQRATRLRQRQLKVLHELERNLAQQALASDPVDAWLPPEWHDRLLRTGIVTLGDLQRAIQIGGRWWLGMPGVGPIKAARLAQLLEQILPVKHEPSVQFTQGAGGTALLRPTLRVPVLQRADLDGSQGTNRAPTPARIDVANDQQAIEAWIDARAGSPLTASVYRREAERWLLWCVTERGKAMSSAGVDDCTAYMAFLNRVPPSWMSRRRVNRHALGWTPFRGQPGLAARRLAVTVLRLMCEWLTHSARYLDFNPWSAVNRRLVDGDEVLPDRVSRSLSKEAFDALLDALPDRGRPGATRNGFVLVFARHTGLRASEMLASTIGDLTRTDDGWTMRVLGKGRKPRQVSVPTPAISVLREYLAGRGLPTVEVCSARTPLLGRDDAPEQAPSYAAVHESFRGLVIRAMRQSALPSSERDRMAKASQHWLRHTFATRWAEADGPMDVLQAELGHASPTTTAGYYTAQQRRRQREAERVASLD